MNISCLIPSALKRRPDGELWLRHALCSAGRQSLRPAEVLVGVDPGVEFYPVAFGPPVRFVHGERPGHQAACNAAAKAAAGPLLAFLEDDDAWQPEHLEVLLREMRVSGAEFVSASQQQVTPDGRPLDVFHFPTCSSWLTTRLLWMQVGGFDLNFQIHHDNRHLGLLNKVGARRLHLVPEGTDLAHPWLRQLARHSEIKAVPGLRSCTVLRTVHDGSVLGGCRLNPERAQRSAKEYAALEVMHGAIPW